VQEEGRPTIPKKRLEMRSTREVRAEPEIPETDQEVSYRKIVLWVLVGLAIVAGVVSYFKYAKLLAPLLS
jgi:hypothetical protein